MMRLRRPLLRLAAVAGAVAVTFGLAGCGDVNAGSGAIRDLHAVVDGWDETLGVDDTVSNSLPWVGTASATVVVDEATSNDRLREMTDELGAFVEESETGTISWLGLDLQVGGFRFPVAEDPSTRAEWFAVFDALRSDERVVGGFVRSDDELVSVDEDESAAVPEPRVLAGTSGTVRAIVADGVTLTEGYQLVRSAADLAEDFRDAAVVAESEDGRSGVTDARLRGSDISKADAPLAPLQLAAAIGRAAPVSDIVAMADALSVRLERSADVDAIRDAFTEQALDLGVDLTIDGGVVTDGGTSGAGVVEAARVLDGREGVTAVEVTGSDIWVTLADASPVSSTIEALLAAPTIDAVSEVSLATAGDQEPGFSLTAAPGGLEGMSELLDAAMDQPTVTHVAATPDSVSFELAADPDAASLRALFSSVRPLIDDGTAVAISAARSGGFSVDVDFVAADDIDLHLERTGDETAALAGLVAAAWVTAE
jgi:hypothetical protein